MPSGMVLKFLVPNLVYLLLVWLAYYKGFRVLGWVVGGVAWLCVAAYALAVATQPIPSSSDDPPSWLVTAVDVTVGAGLLAATAYWTFAGWVLAAILHGLILRRRRRVAWPGSQR